MYHYKVTGTREPTLIFVHGWSCGSWVWLKQVHALAERYRCVTVDLPGHGESPDPPAGRTHSLEEYVTAISDARSTAGASGSVILVGHSMGAAIARNYAVNGSSVAGLVFADGIALDKTSASDWMPPPLIGEAGIRRREAIIQAMFELTTPAELRHHVASQMMACSERTAHEAMQAAWRRSEWIAHPVTVPVLAVYARESQFRNEESVRRLCPNVEFATIEETGHFLMLERADVFNSLLTNFIERVTSGK